jgi:hypothetical protein
MICKLTIKHNVFARANEAVAFKASKRGEFGEQLRPLTSSLAR